MDNGTQTGTPPPTNTPAAPPQATTPSGAGTNWIDQATKLTTQQPANTATIPPKPMEAAPQQQLPTRVITETPKTGVRGFIDKALDALAGDNKVTVYQDQDGNKYIRNVRPTRGEQFMKLAGEGIVGAAAGLAAGKGAGNMGAAAQAGVQAGLKMGQQADEKVKAAQLEVANSQLLAHQLAEQNFALARMKVKADQEDVTFAQNQLDEALKPQADGGPGGQNMGTVGSLGELAGLMKESPEVVDAQVKRGDIRLVAAYGPDNQRKGFHVVMMPPGWGTEMLPAGSPFDVAVPDPDRPGYFMRQTQHSSEPMTRRQQAQYEDAATSKIQAAELIQQKNKEDAQRAADEHQEQLNRNAAEQRNEANQPAAQAHVEAETDEERAAAARDRATVAQTATDQAADVDAIGTGHIAPDRLGYLLARNPKLMNDVVKKYPNIDTAKLEAYPKLVADYTSGHVSQQLNAGATALKHLKQLYDLNTPESRVMGTGAYNAYHNVLDTVVSELGKFYGNDTVPALAGYRKTLGAFFNRGSAIRTQAESMGKKFDSYQKQWTNGAPSPAYEAPMPGIDDEAIQARAFLDPKFEDRLEKDQQKNANPPQAAAPVHQAPPAGAAAEPTPPPGATQVGRNADGSIAGWMVGNKWVPAQQPPGGR